jgi:hypothetical protein
VDNGRGGGVGGGVGGSRLRQSGHWSRDNHWRDGEADGSVGDGAIGSRRRDHSCGEDKRGRIGRFDGSRRREKRVIGGGEGMQRSVEDGVSRTRRGGE